VTNVNDCPAFQRMFRVHKQSTSVYATIQLAHPQCTARMQFISEMITIIWTTNHLGDRRVGDKPTGRQVFVSRKTEVETTGPQLWKCERLMIPMVEQICATLGQRQFNSTYHTLHLNVMKLLV